MASSAGIGSAQQRQQQQSEPNQQEQQATMIPSTTPVPSFSPEMSNSMQNSQQNLHQSPSAPLNTPCQVASNTPFNLIEEDLLYREKHKQLTKYIEHLKRVAEKIGPNEPYTSYRKITRLLEILIDPAQRVTLETLFKCEQVLEKMNVVSYSERFDDDYVQQQQQQQQQGEPNQQQPKATQYSNLQMITTEMVPFITSQMSNLNTPDQVASNIPLNPQQNPLYREKISQLTQYIESLQPLFAEDGTERSISSTETLRKLLEFLNDPIRRYPLAVLLECEKTLQIMEVEAYLEPELGIGSAEQQQQQDGPNQQQPQATELSNPQMISSPPLVPSSSSQMPNMMQNSEPNLGESPSPPLKTADKFESIKEVIKIREHLNNTAHVPFEPSVKYEKVLLNMMAAFPNPLMELANTILQSSTANQALFRKFHPSSSTDICATAPAKIPRLAEKPSQIEREIPHVLQEEIAQLDRKFKVTLDIFTQNKAKSIKLICCLDDKHLPSVPPISVEIPEKYPWMSPSPDCILTKFEYSATPFLRAVHDTLIARIAKLPECHLLSNLLDTWEVSVRQACSLTVDPLNTTTKK